MFTLPNLDYSYDSLEPFFDRQTMEIHHTKHHQGYVDKLNKVLESYPELQNLELKELISDVQNLPQEIKQSIINFGGGVFNHNLFWKILSPQKQEPNPELMNIIEKNFTSFEEFKQRFTQESLKLFGSGWVWLVRKNELDLDIVSTANQDNPLNNGLGEPILGLDLWEHSYYLKYQNRRNEYIESFWNIVNWDYVYELFNNKS